MCIVLNQDNTHLGQHTFFTCENVCCPKTGEILIVYFLDDIKNTAVYLGLVNNGIWLLWLHINSAHGGLSVIYNYFDSCMCYAAISNRTLNGTFLIPSLSTRGLSVRTSTIILSSTYVTIAIELTFSVLRS